MFEAQQSIETEKRKFPNKIKRIEPEKLFKKKYFQFLMFHKIILNKKTFPIWRSSFVLHILLFYITVSSRCFTLYYTLPCLPALYLNLVSIISCSRQRCYSCFLWWKRKCGEISQMTAFLISRLLWQNLSLYLWHIAFLIV